MADLSTLEVIDPDTKESQEGPQCEEGPIRTGSTPLLNLLIGEHIPYAHCAWCTESFRTLSQLESHYMSEHRVVLRPSCCSRPSVFQTSMGMELQLRHSNFGPFSIGPVKMRWDMDFDEAKEIIGAYCVTREENVKEWFVKVLLSIRESTGS